jgi:hypothetical protein
MKCQSPKILFRSIAMGHSNPLWMRTVVLGIKTYQLCEAALRRNAQAQIELS